MFCLWIPDQYLNLLFADHFGPEESKTRSSGGLLKVQSQDRMGPDDSGVPTLKSHRPRPECKLLNMQSFLLSL